MTQDYLLYLFEYRDGNLYWKVDKKKVKPGQKAGSRKPSGYYSVKIDYKSYRLHRLIFMYHHGYMPRIIDHIDTDRSNNKIENLRECSVRENAYNSKILKSNTSGVKGVHWCKIHEKWIARCRADGKRHSLGYFSDIKDAENAVKSFRKLHHKEFCNHG